MAHHGYRPPFEHRGILTVVDLLQGNDRVRGQALLGLGVEHKGLWCDSTVLWRWRRHGGVLLSCEHDRGCFRRIGDEVCEVVPREQGVVAGGKRLNRALASSRAGGEKGKLSEIRQDCQRRCRKIGGFE